MYISKEILEEINRRCKGVYPYNSKMKQDWIETILASNPPFSAEEIDASCPDVLPDMNFGLYPEDPDAKITFDSPWHILKELLGIKPKYRPYANAKECFADVKKHGGWIISGGNQYRQITGIGYGCYPDIVKMNSCNWMKFGELFEAVWADDGTPCGVKED